MQACNGALASSSATHVEASESSGDEEDGGGEVVPEQGEDPLLPANHSTTSTQGGTNTAPSETSGGQTGTEHNTRASDACVAAATASDACAATATDAMRSSSNVDIASQPQVSNPIAQGTRRDDEEMQVDGEEEVEGWNVVQRRSHRSPRKS